MSKKDIKRIKKVLNKLLSDGNIDRQKLAKIVFNNKEKREELDKLTFEYVVKEIKNLIKENKEKEIVLDAPLLIESKLNELCNFTIGDYQI